MANRGENIDPAEFTAAGHMTAEDIRQKQRQQVADAGGVKIDKYPATLYNYAAGVYRGVFVTEEVMRKLVKLQAEHLEKVKRLLSDNADKLHHYNWGLHYGAGKQLTVHYIQRHPTSTIEQAIKWATTSCQPKACYPIFIANNATDAGLQADEHFRLTGERSKD